MAFGLKDCLECAMESFKEGISACGFWSESAGVGSKRVAFGRGCVPCYAMGKTRSAVG